VGVIRSFLREFAVEDIKSKIKPYLGQILDAVGEDSVKILIDNNMSLWTAWPDKAKILQFIRGRSSRLYDISSISVEVVTDAIADAIREDLVQYSFIPRWWIRKTLENLKADL